MRERPTGEELLTIARKVLREELMPLLPEERRYDALMVANAMAIAGRQLALGDAVEDSERRKLADLLGETMQVDNPAAATEVVGDLYSRLCAGIRSGAFDPGTPCHNAMYTFLLDMTVQKLRESAPKYLEAQGKGKTFREKGFVRRNRVERIERRR